ncbi:pilin [Acinetobacter sp. NIPH 2100]|uniref:pilin n=1 Tax=Acinetobacter sp. NIPH 2100 TaxID=1217708 RepID=UPI003A101E27
MQKGFTLIELMIVVAIIGILAAIAIPQYQNYIAKSQVSRVMSETGSLKTAVEDCVLNGKTAANACELGWTASNLLGGTQQVNGQAGLTVTIGEDANTPSTIVARFGASAATAIAGQGLTWTRSSAGAWSCATTVLAKYKPAGCASSGS